MKLFRGREFRVNLDNYEHMQVSAGITIGPEDFGYTDADVAAMSDTERSELAEKQYRLAMERLAAYTSDDLDAATQHARSDSFLVSRPKRKPRTK